MTYPFGEPGYVLFLAMHSTMQKEYANSNLKTSTLLIPLDIAPIKQAVGNSYRKGIAQLQHLLCYLHRVCQLTSSLNSCEFLTKAASYYSTYNVINCAKAVGQTRGIKVRAHATIRNAEVSTAHLKILIKA